MAQRSEQAIAPPSPVPAWGRYRPDSSTRSTAWSHTIRCLVGGYRVAIPELGQLAGFERSGVVAALRGERWELRMASPSEQVVAGVEIDRRWRVRVPLGVRHCLGLSATLVVSCAADGSRVVVWPSEILDHVLGER